jgi:hypothetical protein
MPLFAQHGRFRHSRQCQSHRETNGKMVKYHRTFLLHGLYFYSSRNGCKFWCNLCFVCDSMFLQALTMPLQFRRGRWRDRETDRWGAVDGRFSIETPNCILRAACCTEMCFWWWRKNLSLLCFSISTSIFWDVILLFTCSITNRGARSVCPCRLTNWKLWKYAGLNFDDTKMIRKPSATGIPPLQ